MWCSRGSGCGQAIAGGSHLPPRPELKSRRVAAAVGVPLVRAVAGHRPPAQKPGAFF